MKQLTDYKEEIHKCSKCGLCQSVCPVYKETGNDCAVSRGKFIMLNGVVKGDLELNSNIARYLDMCLKCNACKDFCPSGIDAREIFTSAKAEYFRNSSFALTVKVFQSKAVFTFILYLLKAATTVYRTLKLDKIMRKFYPLLFKLGVLGKQIILANEFVLVESGLEKVGKVQEDFSKPLNTLKVVYFKGCVNEFVNPSVKIAAETILNKLGVEILPADFHCCGIPFLSSGNAEQFKKQAELNLSKIPEVFDFFLTDCASCADAFVEYKKVITDEKLLKKLDKILLNSVNISDFISSNIEKISFKEKTKVTFHKPCHMDDHDFVLKMLKKVDNVEYVEMDEFDKCCGFSGEFAVKNPKLSEIISSKKAKNIIATESDFVLTACPSCKLGLIQGLVENGVFTPVLNLAEFISMGEII